LAAAVGARKGLLFNGAVPPEIDQQDAGGAGEIETGAAAAQGGEENALIRVGGEFGESAVAPVDALGARVL